jgi:hypothetical protein
MCRAPSTLTSPISSQRPAGCGTRRSGSYSRSAPPWVRRRLARQPKLQRRSGDVGASAESRPGTGKGARRSPPSIYGDDNCTPHGSHRARCSDPPKPAESQTPHRLAPPNVGRLIEPPAYRTHTDRAQLMDEIRQVRGGWIRGHQGGVSRWGLWRFGTCDVRGSAVARGIAVVGPSSRIRSELQQIGRLVLKLTTTRQPTRPRVSAPTGRQAAA